MNKKHTPGPWVVCPGVVLQIPVASVAMEGLKLNVAHVAGIRDGEGVANARLIAAAPDLLEALSDMLEVHGVRWEHVRGDSSIPGSWAELSDKARAAIAKATGEQA